MRGRGLGEQRKVETARENTSFKKLSYKIRREIRQCLDEIANQGRISLQRSELEHIEELT